MTAIRHWARDYIHRPWAPDGDGPERFSCWGLVRHVYRARHGIELPHVVVGEAGETGVDNVVAIKQVVRAAGLRPLGNVRPQDGDIVVLRSLIKLHCGLLVRANGRLGVLHSAHDIGVSWQPWALAIAGMTPELWRRAA